MAVRHDDYPVEGVQFHPESIRMKPYGIKILKNFLVFLSSSKKLHPNQKLKKKREGKKYPGRNYPPVKKYQR